MWVKAGDESKFRAKCAWTRHRRSCAEWNCENDGGRWKTRSARSRWFDFPTPPFSDPLSARAGSYKSPCDSQRSEKKRLISKKKRNRTHIVQRDSRFHGPVQWKQKEKKHEEISALSIVRNRHTTRKKNARSSI